jgi:hypothetical protein
MQYLLFMARIPSTIRQYFQKHRKTKSIRWAIKYYNDNYIYTEWDKPSGTYIKKNSDKTRGFKRRNKLLNEQLILSNDELII